MTWTDPATGRDLMAAPPRAGLLRSRPAPAGASVADRKIAELRALKAEVNRPSLSELKSMRDAVNADEYRRQAEQAQAARGRLAALHRLRRAMEGRRRPNAAERLAMARAEDAVAAAERRVTRASRAQMRLALAAAGLPTTIVPPPRPAARAVPAGVADFTRPLAGRSFASPRPEPPGYSQVRRFMAINDAAVTASASPVSYPCRFCGGASRDPAATAAHERMHQRAGATR